MSTGGTHNTTRNQTTMNASPGMALDYDEYDTMSINSREYDDALADMTSSGLHWQKPSVPFEMRIDLAHADEAEKQLIADELELDVDDLDSLEIYAERLGGNLLYISFNDVRFDSVEDIPYPVKNFLDNIQFGDAEEQVITASGTAVNFWDALHGDPEALAAINQYDFEIGNPEVEVVRGFSPTETMERYDSADYKPLNDSIDDKIMQERLEKYFEQKDKQKKRRRLVLSLLGVIALAGVVVWFVVG